MKKMLINIMNMAIRYNKSEYGRLTGILEEYKDKLSELHDNKSEINHLKVEIEDTKKLLSQAEIKLREKQKEYEISASEDNINLFNSIKNNKEFDPDDMKSTLN
jgi:hypothetical protein